MEEAVGVDADVEAEEDMVEAVEVEEDMVEVAMEADMAAAVEDMEEEEMEVAEDMVEAAMEEVEDTVEDAIGMEAAVDMEEEETAEAEVEAADMEEVAAGMEVVEEVMEAEEDVTEAVEEEEMEEDMVEAAMEVVEDTEEDAMEEVAVDMVEEEVGTVEEVVATRSTDVSRSIVVKTTTDHFCFYVLNPRFFSAFTNLRNYSKYLRLVTHNLLLISNRLSKRVKNFLDL